MMKYTKVFAPILFVCLFSLTLLQGVCVAAEKSEKSSVTQEASPIVKTTQGGQTKLVLNGKEFHEDSSVFNIRVKGRQGLVVVNGKTFAIDTSKGVSLRITSKSRPAEKGDEQQSEQQQSTADEPPLTKAQQQLRAFFGPDWKRHVVRKSEKGQRAIQVSLVKEKSKHKVKPKKGKFKHKEKYKEKRKAP